jgi:hypothetical protein
VKAPWTSSFTSSSKRCYIHNVSVTIDTVIHNLMWYTYWNTCFETRSSTNIEYYDFIVVKSWTPGSLVKSSITDLLKSWTPGGLEKSSITDDSDSGITQNRTKCF